MADGEQSQTVKSQAETGAGASGSPAHAPRPTPTARMEIRWSPRTPQRLGWLGAALVVIGLFVPTQKLSDITVNNHPVEFNLWQYSIPLAVLLLVTALASAWATGAGRYRWLWVTGGVSAVLGVIALVTAGSVAWGWIVLMLGAGFTLLAAWTERSVATS